MTSADPAAVPDLTETAPMVDLDTYQRAMDTIELVTEKAAESLRSLRMEDRGWSVIGSTYQDAPQHSTLVENADLVRALAWHPLMLRGRTVRASYVWGEGVTIAAHYEDKDADAEVIDQVVQDYIADDGNASAWFGHTAAIGLEHDLFFDGNVFGGHWVNPRTGDVKVRQVPFPEIVEIRTAPGDYATPHLYLRQWTVGSSQVKAWYPDLDYDPVTKQRVIDGAPVLWPGTTHPGLGNGAAIQHVPVNPAARNTRWGVGDGYAALQDARGYSDFLSDTRHLYAALAKIAHVVSTASNPQAAARAGAQATLGAAGGTMYGDQSLKVDSPSFSGINPTLGRPYAAMAAAALGVPVTVLTADPGQEGARAVAETLDRPMRLAFQARQRVWADAYRASIRFKLRMAVEAPGHPLKASVRQVGDRKFIDWPAGQAPVIDIVFPDIQDDNMAALIESVTKADATGKMPPLTTLRLLLQALEVEDAETIVQSVTSPDGHWEDPTMTAAVAAGNRAAKAARDGEDL